MKTIFKIFLFLGLVSACNSVEKSENVDQDSTQSETEVVDNSTEKTVKNLIEINTDEALIATALMAAPEESRADATVIGYNMAGEFITLKEGSNELICLADDPKKDGFNAACYHKDMEPFMARGRELKQEGKGAVEIFQIREEEAKSGKLSMGNTGSTLHIYYGKNTTYDPETNKVDGAKYRYVVYMPWATSASTGLPEKPLDSNHPWIMNPGTHRAHIMISPVNKSE